MCMCSTASVAFFRYTVFVILRKGARARFKCTCVGGHLTIPWLCLQKTPSIRGSSWLAGVSEGLWP